MRYFEVELRVLGKKVLTIGSNCLCGVNDIDTYRDEVLAAA